jgi:DNA-binding MarR family transcriptional regulator
MSDFDYYESALLRLRRVASYLTMRYGDVIKTTKLTPVQFEILLYLDSFAPCSVSDVAQFMVVDKSTSSRVLRGIEDRGLIQLELDSEDRRRRKIRLTEGGLHVVDMHKLGWLKIEKDVRTKYDEAIEHLESA